MDKKIVKFGESEIEKHKFHQQKIPILIYVIDIRKILISKKVSFGKKGFKILLVTKKIKKLDRYVQYFQK